MAQKPYSFGNLWWEICRANGIHVKPTWYEHQPQAVIENDSCKILWDFTVETDHFIIAKKTDMTVIDEEHHEGQITDFAIPYGTSEMISKWRRLRDTWIWPEN